ncbi:type II secretion system F family protein [Pantoea sp. BAV 3049]|uniref:type II secretion system F family protein n=1 Tax=Pantoea sp. BAV 3049 TaxID=2654188 RepID=UPI00131D897C|nr:type II secretion system F family protein [Pantoea sp. BAV 3049]
MRSLFLFIVVFGCLCLLTLLQRRRLTSRAMLFRGRRGRTLQSLLGQPPSALASESVMVRLRQAAGRKIRTWLSVLEPENKKVFFRNLLIPQLVSAGVIAINAGYVNLPTLWIAPPVTLIIFMAWHAMLDKRKRKQFNQNFMEALTSVGGAVSSGRTFVQAMSDYAFMSDSALGREFGIVSRRLNLGDNPEQVFNESWKRFPYREYYFFIVAILLNINSGGKLKEVLNKLQRSISTGVAMEKKMLAMTSEMRMSTKITGAIPFVFLILLRFISVENFEFVLHDEKGNYILWYLLASELTGITIIKFLMRGI